MINEALHTTYSREEIATWDDEAINEVLEAVNAQRAYAIAMGR